MQNDIKLKINTNKEILSGLPQNNKKNILKYQEQIESLINEYNKYKNDILSEMYNRKTTLSDIKQNKDLDVTLKTILSTDDIIYLLNTYNTSYEKMELDKDLYDVSRFYRTNFEKVNEDLVKIINKYRLVGLDIKYEDFNYSVYANKYMTVFINELSNNSLNYNVLKECFDTLYWQCPDIFTHIELNLKDLYYSNKKLFDKYVNNQKNKVFTDFEKSGKEIMEDYLLLQRNYDELYNSDTYLILQDFLTKKLNTKDYTLDRITKNFNDFISDPVTDNDEFNNNIKKLYNSLNEYKEYLHFLYLIDGVKKLYSEKDKFKNVVKNKFTIISSNEKKIKKLNKKIVKYMKRGKSELANKFSLTVDSLIFDTKKLYDELDMDVFNEQVLNKLSDDSSIYDLLCLVYSYYLYFIACIKKNDANYTAESIELEVNRLRKFLISPYNTIIGNISIVREKNIPMIISDCYKLLNLNVSMDVLNSDNIDNLIESTAKIKKYYNVLNCRLVLEDISFICDTETILTEEEYVSVLE